MKKIIIPADALKAACLFAEELQGATKPNLGCVHIEATGTQTRITSTNGHVGLIQQYQVKNEDIVRETVLIPVGTFPEFVEEGKTAFALMLGAKGSAELCAEHGTKAFQNVGGVYPDLSFAVTDFPSGEVSQFDPDYLARFAEAAYYLHTDRDAGFKPAMNVLHNGPKGAALIRFGTNENALGIAMPVTPESTEKLFTAPPAWVKQPMHVSGEIKDKIVITAQTGVTTAEDDLFGGTPAKETKEPPGPAKAAPRKTRAKKEKAEPAAKVTEADDCSDLV